jgi:tetratricopeptide (TPR) repeat protein
LCSQNNKTQKAMTKKTKNEDPENLQKIESSLTKAEQYIEENQKKLTYIIGGLVIIIALFFVYKNRIVEPKNTKAVEAIWGAERFFEIDSFHIALYGNENVIGFLDVVDTYGSTKSGNLARYYAGVCYLRMGENDNAIKLMRAFKPEENLLAQMKENVLGDAHSNNGNYKEAAGFYERAADISSSDEFSPLFLLKAGQCYEKIGDTKRALDVYNRIKDTYAHTEQGKDIDKYIVRVTFLK